MSWQWQIVIGAALTIALVSSVAQEVHVWYEHEVTPVVDAEGGEWLHCMWVCYEHGTRKHFMSRDVRAEEGCIAPETYSGIQGNLIDD